MKPDIFSELSDEEISKGLDLLIEDMQHDNERSMTMLLELIHFVLEAVQIVLSFEIIGILVSDKEDK